MKMIIAIPTSNDCLCQHFGHCEKFVVFETENSRITRETHLVPPPHQPGILPAWLASKGITHVISGGMGHRAISLFNQQNITVFTGAEEKQAISLAEDLINDRLITSVNACDH